MTGEGPLHFGYDAPRSPTGSNPSTQGQMRLRVRRDRVRPQKKLARPRRRLRRRRVSDDQPADRKRKNDRNGAEFLARAFRQPTSTEGGSPTASARRPDPDPRALEDARREGRRSNRCSRSSCSGTGWSSTRPTRQAREGKELDAAHWAWMKSVSVRREGRQRSAGLLHRPGEPGDRGQGPPGEAGGGRGVEAQVEEAGGLRPAAWGHRRHDGRRPGLRGRRGSQVQNARSFARVDRP